MGALNVELQESLQDNFDPQDVHDWIKLEYVFETPLPEQIKYLFCFQEGFTYNESKHILPTLEVFQGSVNLLITTYPDLFSEDGNSNSKEDLRDRADVSEIFGMLSQITFDDSNFVVLVNPSLVCKFRELNQNN